MAATRCISDVPGLAKHTSTPEAASVRSTLSAPFMPMPSGEIAVDCLRHARHPRLKGVTDDALPELRASDADRERTADLLRHAAGEGRLTMEELDERLHSVYAARTHRELDGLTADVAVRDQTGTGTRRMTIRPGDEGRNWMMSGMRGAEAEGR